MRLTPDMAAEPSFPEFRHPVSSRILAVWDAAFLSLWSTDPDVAIRSATNLYAPETPDGNPNARTAEAISFFLQQLHHWAPTVPSTAEERYRTVVVAVWHLVRRVRRTPAQPFIEDSLAIALRPVGRLQAGALTAEICAALYDYHRGVWTPHLTRPQRQRIQWALAAALASLPPDEMEVFWDNLHSSNALMRGAMCLGLEWLTSDHAVPHLLSGLDRSTDSETRFAIVDNLARIGDPRALPRLYTLRRLSALTDWPLARRVSAAIEVIERLNRGQAQRSLLRPAQAPPPDPGTLLRSTNESDRSSDSLLHPTDPPSSS